jgi:hypothetical protein
MCDLTRQKHLSPCKQRFHSSFPSISSEIPNDGGGPVVLPNLLWNRTITITSITAAVPSFQKNSYPESEICNRNILNGILS